MHWLHNIGMHILVRARHLDVDYTGMPVCARHILQLHQLCAVHLNRAICDPIHTSEIIALVFWDIDEKDICLSLTGSDCRLSQGTLALMSQSGWQAQALTEYCLLLCIPDCLPYLKI